MPNFTCCLLLFSSTFGPSCVEPVRRTWRFATTLRPCATVVSKYRWVCSCCEMNSRATPRWPSRLTSLWSMREQDMAPDVSRQPCLVRRVSENANAARFGKLAALLHEMICCGEVMETCPGIPRVKEVYLYKKSVRVFCRNPATVALV